ncbi:MAG: radical SAM protein [Dehalococcoidia bacterium]|nr:radical SAM protein [Dehalococcoidia bacterium]
MKLECRWGKISVDMSFLRPDIIRPPSEWKSYFLPLTSGCSNNTCAFCGFYGSKLQTRDLDDVKSEIDALSLFMQGGICLPAVPNVVYAIGQGWDGKRIFLQDGDALVYPFAKLREVLQYVNEKLPPVERIGTYATPQDILRRTPEQLGELKGLKLSIFYMGVESGDDEVLQKVVKGANRQELIEAGKKVKEAGVTLSVTVILGLGGVEGSDEHVLETAKVLTEIDPDYVGALTLTLVPGTPLYEQWQEGKFHPITPFRSLEELKIIIENSSFTDCFFSSMHASNYISVRGKLPQGKDRMLRELEAVLAMKDPSLLKPEFLRGL